MIGVAVTNDQQLTEKIDTSHGWLTIGVSEMVPEGAPIAVHCGTTDIVCFRDKDGTARSLLDQCLHRRAPLSLGKIAEEGWVECPYHGWRYDGSNGRCMKVPNLSSAERVPTSYRVPAYATVERDGFIHVWSGGDEEPSDEPPTLACGSLGIDEQMSRLFAFPREALVDLLLDAPSAVLDLRGLRIVNEHRFGDPLRSASELSVMYAVVDAATEPDTLVSEYPYRLALVLDCVHDTMSVTLFSRNGAVAARAVIAFLAVKKVLSSVSLRSTHGHNADNSLSATIGLQASIDPQAALAAVDYVSRLR